MVEENGEWVEGREKGRGRKERKRGRRAGGKGGVGGKKEEREEEKKERWKVRWRGRKEEEEEREKKGGERKGRGRKKSRQEKRMLEEEKEEGDEECPSQRLSPFCPTLEAFDVDPDSGLVTTKRPLQSYERFNLTVVATDGGEPPLWGTTMLLVEVIDVNDNRPVFVRPPNGTILHIKEACLSLAPLPTPCHFL